MFGRIGRTAGLAIGFIALGFAVIGFAWNGAASKDCVQCQLPYVISGGITGLGMIGLGAALLIFEAGRRARGRIESKIDALIDALQGVSPNGSRQQSEETAERPALLLDGTVVIGRSSFHRPDCRLVVGKEDLDYASRDEAIARGLAPCRVCEPTREEQPVEVATRRRARRR